MFFSSFIWRCLTFLRLPSACDLLLQRDNMSTRIPILIFPFDLRDECPGKEAFSLFLFLARLAWPKVSDVSLRRRDDFKGPPQFFPDSRSFPPPLVFLSSPRYEQVAGLPEATRQMSSSQPQLVELLFFFWVSTRICLFEAPGQQAGSVERGEHSALWTPFCAVRGPLTHPVRDAFFSRPRTLSSFLIRPPLVIEFDRYPLSPSSSLLPFPPSFCFRSGSLSAVSPGFFEHNFLLTRTAHLCFPNRDICLPLFCTSAH